MCARGWLILFFFYNFATKISVLCSVKTKPSTSASFKVGLKKQQREMQLPRLFEKQHVKVNWPLDESASQGEHWDPSSWAGFQSKWDADSSEREQGAGEAVYNHGEKMVRLSRRRHHCKSPLTFVKVRRCASVSPLAG